MRFRFLADLPADGPYNMAVDETLFRSALPPRGLATVRLYGFRPPTVSIGYHQQLDEVVDQDACLEHGIEWVRRPTGGRALLHQHELTYSVAAPVTGSLLGLSVRGVYELVNGAIRRALVLLGVPLDGSDCSARERSERHPPALPCLAVPEGHEITSAGRKVVASAQRRTTRAFLQHGSVLFRVDEELWGRITPSGGRAPLQAVGIEELSPRATRSALSDALRSAFEEAFEGEAVQRRLDAKERSLVASLRPKYDSEAWNHRGLIG